MEETARKIAAESVTLRAARDEDIAEMVAVVNEAFAVENFFVDRPRTSAALLKEQFSTGQFLLAHSAGALVASLYYELRGEHGYLGMLAVRRDWQGRGISRVMAAAGEDALRGAGCQVAELSVVNLRPDLITLYEKLGYRQVRIEEPMEELRIKLTRPAQLVVMEKPL